MMTCREMVDLVTDYLEQLLPPHERERFEQHLTECPGCAAYVEQMRATIQVMGKLTEESLSPQARIDLLKVFRDWKAGEA